MKKIVIIAGISMAFLAGCATEGHKVVKTETVATHQTAYHGIKSNIAVGKFNNTSAYHNGVFFEGEDRLASQSKTILITDLQQTGRFNVLDRANMQEIATEAKLSGHKQHLQGATYVVTGNVTGFGRKTVGDKQLFGILGRGKEQVAYAEVTLNIVNVKTSQVVYSAQGAGEYSLANREVLGFGGTAGYDATLNDKVLGLAIREAVNKLVDGIDAGYWKPTK